MGNTIINGDLQTTAAGDTVTNQITAALAAEGLGTNAGKLKRVDNDAWEVARRSNGVITAIADAGGGKCLVTSAGHQQTDGTSLTIAGTTDYNATYTISDVTTDNFQITAAYTSSQTGTFWVAANVYYSPDQQGGAFGTIKRRRFVGVTGGATVTLESSFHTTKRLVGQGGHVIDVGTGSTLTVPTYFGSISYVGVNDNGTNLVLLLGSGFDDGTDTYSVHVDYYEP